MTKEQLETRQQIFKELNAIDLGERIKKKLGLSYLSWANAWEILRTKYPDAEYKIYTREVETTETREITDVNTGVKNIKEFLSKTNYMNEKSAAKILNRQKFICLYVCSIEMLDDDAHMKKGTIRKELNLKNLGLYKNNEIY